MDRKEISYELLVPYTEADGAPCGCYVTVTTRWNSISGDWHTTITVPESGVEIGSFMGEIDPEPMIKILSERLTRFFDPPHFEPFEVRENGDILY